MSGPGDVSPPPAAPPTQPTSLALPVQSANWPTVLGVIAIVFGALAILAGLWGLLVPLLFASVANAVPEYQAFPFEMVEDFSVWMVPLSLLGILAAVLLLAAGIGLLKRRRWGVKTGVAWAVIKMAVVLVSAGFGYMAQKAGFEAFRQDPNVPSIPGGVLLGHDRHLGRRRDCLGFRSARVPLDLV